MDLPRISLALVSLVFGIFGLALFFAPEIMRFAFIVPEHPSAKTEIRAFYGGLEIALALFFVLAIFDEKLRDAGLLLAVLLIGGVVLGRFYGIAVDGIEGNYTKYALTIELPLFVMVLWAKWH